MIALHGRWVNTWRKSLTATTQESWEQYWTSPGGSTQQSSNCLVTCHSSRKLSKLDHPNMRDTAGEVGTGSWVMYSYGPLYMDEQMLEPTYNSSVPIQDVTQRKQWTIEKGGRKGSGISVIMTRHDDNDDFILFYYYFIILFHFINILLCF